MQLRDEAWGEVLDTNLSLSRVRLGCLARSFPLFTIIFFGQLGASRFRLEQVPFFDQLLC